MISRLLLPGFASGAPCDVLLRGAPHGAKALRPAEEPLVTLCGRWYAQLAQAPAQKMVHGHRRVEVQVCVSTPKIASTLVSGLSAPIIVTCAQLLSMSRSLLSTRRAGEDARYCDGSR